jgi:hypothetical protein
MGCPNDQGKVTECKDLVKSDSERDLRGYREVMSPARYRCAACGNLTRFDVVADRRTRAFHHYSVGGELSVEDEEVVHEHIIDVTCRWCGHGDAVEFLDEGSAS